MIAGPELPLIKPTVIKTSTQRFLTGLSITTDSVVAVLKFTSTTNPKKIVVIWGDGEQDEIDGTPGVPSIGILPGDFEFSHAYASSSDGKRFSHDVVVVVLESNGELEIYDQSIQLVPRYRIDIFPISFRLLSPCDRSGQTSEFVIKSNRENDETLTWKLKPSNNFFAEATYQVLEGSGNSKEVVPDNLELGFSVRFSVTETDPGQDTTVIAYAGCFWYDDAGEEERTYELNAILFGSCRFRIRYYRRSVLVVPRTNTMPLYTNK